jgi:cytochrome c
VLGEPIGQGRGFGFTPALANKGGTWDWHSLDAWLASPKTFASGTKMSFPGLSNPQDRANVIAYLNQQSDAPKPLPAAPAAAAAAPTTDGITEQQAGQNPKNVGGEGAPKVSGPASVATREP